MTQETQVEHFTTKAEALERMRALMRRARQAGNMGAVYAVVPGPDGGWSVADIGTAIDLGLGYEWEAV